MKSLKHPIERVIAIIIIYLTMAQIIPSRLSSFFLNAPLSRTASYCIFFSIFVFFLVLRRVVVGSMFADEDPINIGLVAPVGAFLLLENYPNPPILFVAILAIGGLYMAVTTFLRWQWVSQGGLTRGRRNRRIKKSVSHLYSIAAGTLGCIGVLYFVASITSSSFTLLHDPQENSAGTLESEWIYDAVVGCGVENKQVWVDMSVQERSDLLEIYVDCEELQLGVPASIRLVIQDLEEGTLGEYNHELGCIRLNADLVTDGTLEDCVSTIIHEMRHCYQYYLCDIYELLPEKYQNLSGIWQAELYLSEFCDYDDGDDDYYAYYYQACEIDARAYADAQISYYFPQN